MRDPDRRSIVARVARVAFAFVVMNTSAVAGLITALIGNRGNKRVWR